MYRRNEDGAVIDPPVMQDHERRIYEVMQQDPGNTAKIERLAREYDEARTKLADEEDEDERRNAEDQAVRDADARSAYAARNPPPDSPNRESGEDKRTDPPSGMGLGGFR